MNMTKGVTLKTEQNGNVTSVYFDVQAGWQKWFMLTSDEHYDSVACNRRRFKQDMETAKQRNALILRFGDFFDAMQGKFDPRRSMDDLRPEFRRSDYYDFVVMDAANYLEPYAKQHLLFGLGNHETGVIRNANTNLTDRLIHELNHRGGDILPGSYGGWVRFMFKASGRAQCSLKLYYYHGKGGSAPVTKGTIDTARQAAYLPDADIVVNGHNHNAYWLPVARRRLSNKGVEYNDACHFIRTPGYKQPILARHGFDIEKLTTPKPIGCVWMRLFFEGGKIRKEFTPAVE